MFGDAGAVIALLGPESAHLLKGGPTHEKTVRFGGVLGSDSSQLVPLFGVGGDIKPRLFIIDHPVEGDVLGDDDAAHPPIVGRSVFSSR